MLRRSCPVGACSCCIIFAVIWNVLPVGGVPFGDFFPFGSTAGDRNLPPIDDGSEQVTIGLAFPFAGRNSRELYVNNNGYISLDAPVVAFFPQAFPLYNSLLIAPFWADVDTRGINGGTVWYSSAVSEPLILNRIEELIESGFPNHVGFSPEYVFIATWDHVGYFDRHTERRNTFQCVLATDHNTSFAIFLYANGEIQWTTGDSAGGTNGFGGIPAQVGINTGDKISSVTIPESLTPEIINISTTTNVEVPGLWVFQVDQEPEGPLGSDDNEAMPEGDNELTGFNITIGFAQPSYTIREDGGNITVCLNVVCVEQHTGVINVHIITVDLTATAEDDYMPVSSNLTVNCTAMQERITVSIVGDEVVEDTEQFILEIKKIDSAVLVTIPSTTIHITDCSVVRLGFVMPSLTVNESEPMSVCVRAQGELARDVFVKVSTNASGSASEMFDFTPLTTSVTFSGTSLRRCLDVTIIDDQVVEATEDFTITLATGDTAVNVTTDSVNIMIRDTSAVEIGLVESTYTVNEADDTGLAICVELREGTLERSVTVVLNSMDITATTSDDVLSSQQLTFPPGSSSSRGSSVCSTLQVENDDILEPAVEMFRILISSSDPAVVISPDFQSAIVSITGDITDDIEIGLMESTYTVNEADDTARELCVELIQGTLERSVTVVLNSMDGTATTSVPVDYVLSSQQLIFPPGSSSSSGSSVCSTLQVENDDILEPAVETFRIIINSSDPAVVISPDFQSAIVSITEDITDVVVVGLDSQQYRFTEGQSGELAICAEINGGILSLERDVTVVLNTVDGSATSSGIRDDFMPIGEELTVLTFTSGTRRGPTSRRCRTIPVVNDDAVESNETFTVVLSRTQEDSAVVNLRNGFQSATVTIMEDMSDRITVRLTSQTYTVIESGFNVIVSAVLSSDSPGRLERDLVVNMEITDGTAMRSEDYFAMNTIELTFTSGSRPGTIRSTTIRIRDDAIPEGAETIMVDLVSSSQVILGNPSSATVVILGDDAVSIGMVQSEYTVEETDLEAEICLRLNELDDEQLGINITVQLTTADVTATTDLVPLPANDTFCNPEEAVGDYETVQMLQVEFISTSIVGAISCTRPPITINDDMVVEDPETFVVSIIDSLPPGFVNVDSSANSATVSIISDARDQCGGTDVNITLHPTNTTLEQLFESVNLTCLATGRPTPMFRWFRNNVSIDGATLPYYSIPRVEPDDRGFYTCRVYNSRGVVSTSSPALISIRGLLQYSVNLAAIDSDTSADNLVKRATNCELQDVVEQLKETLPGVFVINANASVEDLSDPDTNVSTVCMELDIRVTVTSQNGSAGVAVGLTDLIQDAVPLGIMVTVQRFDGCSEDVTSLGGGLEIEWPESDIGMVIMPCPCGSVTGSINRNATRFCFGNFDERAEWGIADVSSCNFSQTALELCAISLMSSDVAARSLVATTANATQLQPVEITIAAAIVEQLTEDATTNLNITDDYLEVIDQLLDANPSSILESQEISQSSSRLILSLQDFAAAIPIINDNDTFTRNNFALQVHEIEVVDESTTIVLPQVFVANLGDIDQIQSVDIDDAFQTFDDETDVGDQPTAFSNLPRNVFERTISQLSGNDTVFRVCYTVFLDDVLFQLRNMSELAVTFGRFRTGSLIISARVGSGPPPENLTDPAVFFFQKSEEIQNGRNTTCVFWDFDADGGFGGWSTRGCFLREESETNATCECDHLTNFGILLDLTPRATPVTPSPPREVLALEFITYIGIVISITALTVTIFTYLISRKLRSGLYGQMLMNSCTALLGFYFSFIAASLKSRVPLPDVICGIFSALLQYFMLAYFFWTAAESVLLYLKLVKVFGIDTTHYALKAGIISWISPAFLVGLLVAPTSSFYISRELLCFPEDIPFYIGVVAPFGVIYIFNFIMFVVIMHCSCRHTPMKYGRSKSELRKNALIGLILAVTFGLGWIFGLLGTTSLPDAVRLPGVYLFIILVGTQGLLIFLLRVLRSPDVHSEWKKWFYTLTCRVNSYNQSSRQEAVVFENTKVDCGKDSSNTWL